MSNLPEEFKNLFDVIDNLESVKSESKPLEDLAKALAAIKEKYDNKKTDETVDPEVVDMGEAHFNHITVNFEEVFDAMIVQIDAEVAKSDCPVLLGSAKVMKHSLAASFSEASSIFNNACTIFQTCVIEHSENTED